MKKIVIIPARLKSERLSGKPLKLILSKPMINWTFEAARESSADEVKIATDSKKIFDNFSKGDAFITDSNHLSGTDRSFEVANMLKLEDHDVVINLQGDEPFIDPLDLDNLFKIMQKDKVQMATLYSKLSKKEELDNENIVKIQVEKNLAKKFFRKTIFRNNIFIHQGVYAFKFKTLRDFVSWKPSKNEKKHKLEQLRAMDNGIKINAIRSVSKIHIGVDTKEDLIEANEIAKKYLK